MKLSHGIRSWYKSRRLAHLWWSLPVLLVFAAWIAFAFCLMQWKAGELTARYAAITDRALDRKEFETARIAAQRMLSFGADPRPKWLFDLGLAQAGLGHDREASKIFGTVAPLETPGYYPAHIFLAHALLMKTNVTTEDLLTAEKHLNHALSLNQKNSTINELLIQIYIRTGQWEVATERLKDLVPTKPEAGLLLAAVLKTRGDNLGARSWAERSARYHKDKVEASQLDLPRNRQAWAQALVMLDDYSLALSVLTNGWANSHDPAYPAQIGDVCAAWGETITKSKPADLASRISLIQQGLQFAPQNEALLKQLVKVSQLDGPETEKARDTLARILAEGKSSAIVHFALGLDAWNRGQNELARKHFVLSFETAPQMPQVANNMAMILAIGDNPDLPRALAIIQSLIEKYPEEANFRETRGQILVKLARWQDAVVDLEYALPRLGSRPSTHTALADAYTGLGSQALAEQHQRLAKSLAQPATH